MEANNFIKNLKADGKENDECDLDKVYEEYQILLAKVPSKERGTFSLNLLCILCRNLDKVRSWREQINKKSLLILSIDCLRQMRGLDRANQVKSLACVYHLHKYAVSQAQHLQPELVLKVGVMAFKPDVKELITEHSKTYMNLINDRLAYLHTMKGKISITKLLPKLSEDILDAIEICNTVQLFQMYLIFLVKKLLVLYSDNSSAELNNIYAEIFKKISQKNDLKAFKRLNDKQLIDIYRYMCDCMYVIIENGSKICFKGIPIENVVHTAITLVGHAPEIFHCLQTFYLNAICPLLKDTREGYVENIFNNMILSLKTTEKYQFVIIQTYPFIGHFLKMYIDEMLQINEELQMKLFEIIQVMLEKLKVSTQLLKCNNCHISSGWHDALRLSFTAKTLLEMSIRSNLNLTNVLPVFCIIVHEQYEILNYLALRGCANYAKCYLKLQTDVHNTAIHLHKAEQYKYACELFEMYIKNEVLRLKTNVEIKNISRALYNKSICEMDCKLYEEALVNAFLSLVLGHDHTTSKYMSLVMDIKAKLNTADVENKDDLLIMTTVQACKIATDRSLYGNLKPVFNALDFKIILEHEFTKYVELWQSITPMSGLCKTVLDLHKGNYDKWLKVENQRDMLETVVDMILELPFVVRTIHSKHLEQVVTELTSILKVGDMNHRLVCGVLLILKSEMHFKELAVKFGWEAKEQNLNPDEFKAIRTFEQEHECLQGALEAVDMLSSLSQSFKQVKRKWLSHSLRIIEIYVHQFLRLGFTAHGLQLAHLCCQMARILDDKLSYIRVAGTLLYYVNKNTDDVATLLTLAGEMFKDLPKDENSMESAIMFICDCAIYYSRCRSRSAAAKLVLHAQSHVLIAREDMPTLNLDLAIGRLLEAQMQLCAETGYSALTTANTVQRHYLLVANGATKWAHRRLRSLTIKHHRLLASVRKVLLSRGLQLWRRARSAAGAALYSCGAYGQALLLSVITNEWKVNVAQGEIDNRLKHILGLQPTNEIQPDITKKHPDIIHSQQSEIEPVRDNMLFKRTQLSPSIPCNTVQAFKIPEFLLHDSRCRCYACETPSCLSITCRTFCLEACMYFRAKETEIAENYFKGVFKILNICEGRLRNILNSYENKFVGYIVDYVGKIWLDDLKSVHLIVLLNAAYLELAKGRYDIVDSYIVNMHEILQELDNIDPYLNNDISNLMTASAHLRKVVQNPIELGIEEDFEGLTLSPVKNIEILGTPANNRTTVKVQVNTKVHKDEDLPKKRIVVTKFVLDDYSDEKENQKQVSNDFKVPTLAAIKHTMETATPIQSKTPRLLVTQPSQDTPPNLHLGTKKCYKKIPSGSNPRKYQRRSISLDKAETCASSDFPILSEKSSDFPITSENLSDFPITSEKRSQRPHIPNKPNNRRRSKSLEKSTPNKFETLNESERSRVNARSTRSKCKQVNNSDTPTVEFFTPKHSPEKFFTPMTSLKTYPKKSIRSNIVKSLEKEFIDKENIKTMEEIKEIKNIPKVVKEVIREEKENLKEVRSRRKALHRATSPGKLASERRLGRPKN